MIDISITETEFLELFPDKEGIWELLSTTPKSEEELLYRYLPSKMWRLNNLYTIIDKDGDPVTFKMNRAQFRVYAHQFIHWRLIILKSRQQGISTLYLIDYFDDAIFLPNLRCGLMAQDKDAAAPLLERVKYLWDEFDPHFKEFLGRKVIKDNASEFWFNNNSKMLIRTSFRSDTLQRLHISELGKIANKYPQKAKETNTGTLQTIAPGNKVGIESTAEGLNMFKHKWDSASGAKIIGIPPTDEIIPVFQKLWSPEYIHLNSFKPAGKDFYPVFLSWLYDPDCVEFEDQYIEAEASDYFDQIESTTGLHVNTHQRNFWVAQERELEGDIHQEYPATPEEAFTAAKDGTYWSKKYIEYIVRKNRKVPNLFDKNLEVYCVMDLGRGDYTVLLFFQVWQETNGDWTIRIIHSYYNSGEGPDHYADYFKAEGQFREKPTKDYNIKEIGMPHDAEVTDLSTIGNKTRQMIYAENGITNTIILNKMSKADSIDNVRQTMPNIWLDSSCTYIEQCFLYYTKTWDPVLEVWKMEPKRNQYAHGADTVQYMVQYFERYLKISRVARRRDPTKPVGGISL